MQTTQHYPEPTVGALIFDPAGRLFLMRSHKWAGKYSGRLGRSASAKQLDAEAVRLAGIAHGARAV